MSSRHVYLFLDRASSRQRAHFTIFIPNTDFASAVPLEQHSVGTVIHVTGAPMVGFAHQFKRNFDTLSTKTIEKAVCLGSVTTEQLPDPNVTKYVEEDAPLGVMDRLALRVDPPRKSENFLAPVNDTTNRRCQEWMMEYIKLLVANGVLESSAIELAQAERDPPGHGIGLINRA